MGRILFFAACCSVLASPAPAPAYHPEFHYVHQTYVIFYDDDLNVRTVHAPRSAVKRNGGPLSAKQLDALRDHPKPGEIAHKGYQAELSDLTLARFVTIYLEKEVREFGGKTRWVRCPALYCELHHNRPSEKLLVLYAPYTRSGAQPSTLVIGTGKPRTGAQYRNSVALPNVRLKTILVHSYYQPLRVPVRPR